MKQTSTEPSLTFRRKHPTFSFTNRKGDVYYVHEGRTKLGKPKYFVSRNPEGALPTVPNGFEVAEDINAIVFVRRPSQSSIPESDIEFVRASVRACRHLADYKVETKGNAIIIYQPMGLGGIDAVKESDYSMLNYLEPIARTLGTDWNKFVSQMAQKAGCSVEEFQNVVAQAAAEKKSRVVETLRRNLQYDSVLRFVWNERTGHYETERRCYRGTKEWIDLDRGPLKKLAGRFIKHVGKESFFDLM